MRYAAIPNAAATDTIQRRRARAGEPPKKYLRFWFKKLSKSICLTHTTLVSPQSVHLGEPSEEAAGTAHFTTLFFYFIEFFMKSHNVFHK